MKIGILKAQHHITIAKEMVSKKNIMKMEVFIVKLHIQMVKSIIPLNYIIQMENLWQKYNSDSIDMIPIH